MHSRNPIRILCSFVAMLSLALLPVGCQVAYLDADALGDLLQIPSADPAATETADSQLIARPIFDAIEGRIGHHAVTAACMDNGDLIAAWYSYKGPHELDGAAIFTSRLRAGAATWSEPRRIPGLPDRSGNPVLFVDGSTIRLMFAHVPLAWWTSSLRQCESTDGGETWTAPVDVGAWLGANVRNPPIRMADGSWRLPGYSDLWLHGFLLASTDGTTWTDVSLLLGDDEGNLLQPAIARTGEGDALLMVARSRGGERIFAAASPDAGETWTRPSATEFSNPDSAVALTRLVDGSPPDGLQRQPGGADAADRRAFIRRRQDVARSPGHREW